MVGARIKESLSRKIFNISNVLILTLLMVITLYPMLHVLFASLSDGNALMEHRGILLKPLGFHVESYLKIVKYPLLLKSYINTLIIVSVALVINMLITSFGAYFLSRKNVVLGNFVMLFIIFTMYFSGGLIPSYLTIKALGLYDTIWAVILPVSINTFNLIILRTAFASIPESLEESARIDGAGHFRILFSIVIPLSKATFSVIVLYYAVQHWNSWFNAMIYLKSRERYPLQLLLREILIQNDTGNMATGVLDDNMQSVSETLKYAVIIVATVPILCVYPFLQKYFTKGVMVGAVKG